MILCLIIFWCFFFKQKTAYEMRISDWSSDVCSSDLDVIFHKMTEEDWDSVIQVHLKGSFNVARNAADHFRAQESGSFVHFTSTSGLIGNFGQANSSAAKLGIVGLSKSIALDMARFGVRSNCMSPFAWSRLIGTIPSSEDARLGK